MSDFRPELRPLAPSELPFTESARAWSSVLECMPELPAWPRLPQRSFLESPTTQVCEGFPGVIFESDHIYVGDIWDRDTVLDRLYIAYLGGDLDHGHISPEYAACLGLLVAEDGLMLPDSVMAVKGQVLGPLSWALEVMDEAGSPILYNEDLLDVVAKHLRLKAAWQEQALQLVAPVPLMLIEEPLLTAVGLTSLPVEKERALALMEDVLGGLSGYRGIHCAYPVDNAVLNTSVNVLSLDVSHVSEPSGSSVEGLQNFVARGGLIVWGIVPADDRLDEVTVDSLSARLQFWLESLAPGEETREQVISASMISTSGGLAELSEERAEQALALTAELSKTMRASYGFEQR